MKKDKDNRVLNGILLLTGMVLALFFLGVLVFTFILQFGADSAFDARSFANNKYAVTNYTEGNYCYQKDDGKIILNNSTHYIKGKDISYISNDKKVVVINEKKKTYRIISIKNITERIKMKLNEH